MDPIVIDNTGMKENIDVHHLPCTIAYDGHASVGTYFVPTRRANGTLVTYFRGRELEGHEVKLPANVIGYVTREIAPSIGTPAKAPMNVSRASSSSTQDQSYGGSDEHVLYDDEDDMPKRAMSRAEQAAWLKRRRSSHGSGVTTPSTMAAGAGAMPPPDAALPALSDDGSHRNWVVEGSFRSAVYWLHDTPPTGGDLLPRALDWMALQEAVHGTPITQEEMDRYLPKARAMFGGSAEGVPSGAGSTPA